MRLAYVSMTICNAALAFLYIAALPPSPWNTLTGVLWAVASLAWAVAVWAAKETKP